jgi:hypothetical protein
MKSFGIIPVYNHNYIYNATMNDDMIATDKGVVDGNNI